MRQYKADEVCELCTKCLPIDKIISSEKSGSISHFVYALKFRKTVERVVFHLGVICLYFRIVFCYSRLRDDEKPDPDRDPPGEANQRREVHGALCHRHRMGKSASTCLPTFSCAKPK